MVEESAVHSLGGVEDVQLSVLLRKMEHSHTSVSSGGEREDVLYAADGTHPAG